MPSQFSVRIVGLDTLQTGMSKFAHTIEPVTREAIHESMHKALVETLSGYTRPERGYKRTGRLFAGTNMIFEGQSTRIVSSAYKPGGTRDYSGYVLGTGDGTPPGYGQARIHAGIWTPARKAVDDEVRKLTDGGEMDKKLEKSAKDAGL